MVALRGIAANEAPSSWSGAVVQECGRRNRVGQGPGGELEFLKRDHDFWRPRVVDLDIGDVMQTETTQLTIAHLFLVIGKLVDLFLTRNTLFFIERTLKSYTGAKLGAGQPT